MNRNEKVLSKINKNGFGLEIGAGFNPVAPKKDGYKVHVIDHLGKDDLIEKYKDSDMSVANIEEVDFVWNGESYAELTRKKNYYDWVIASHLIEHTPDLIGFINSCEEVLKDDGVLSLVIPDARFCFDHFRPLSGISKIIDAHLQKNKVHTVGTITEFSLETVRKDSVYVWEESSAAGGSYTSLHAPEESKKMIAAADKGEYVDAHSWCFTPHSFRLLISDLNKLGYIKLKEVEFFPTAGCEFFVSLSKNAQVSDIDRIEYLRKIREETQVDVDLSELIKKRFFDKKDYLINRVQNSLKYRLSRFAKK